MSHDPNNAPEKMADFFDLRANIYDDHMRTVVRSFDFFYSEVAKPIQPTMKPIRILDLGCGTGLELDAIFRKAPNAQVTAVDLSGEMLKILAEKYAEFLPQLTLIQDSYLTVPFEEGYYDVVISVMTMHHWRPNEKRELYGRIKASLRSGGCYIEGDYVVEAEEEERLLREYEEGLKENRINPGHTYHIDIPFTLDTQGGLFKEAGFEVFEVIWREDAAAIYMGR